METPKFKGKIFEIVNREIEANGRTVNYEIARRSPGTRLIIVKGNKILLTKEFRHEVGEYDYRLPGGKVYDTLEEYKKASDEDENILKDAKIAAIKEALEETGIKAKNAKFLHKSICGMTIVWNLFYFLIEDFTEGAQELEDDEDIEVQWFDKDKAKEMCLDGSMKEERSALVLLKYLENKF